MLLRLAFPLLALLLASCAPSVGVQTTTHVPDYFELDVSHLQTILLREDWDAKTAEQRADLCRRWWQEPDMVYAYYREAKIVYLYRAAFDKFFLGACGEEPGQSA